jgi:hypothetical protein
VTQPPESRLFSRAGLGLFVVLLGAVAVYATRPLSNNDTYFHLRFGQEFLHHWTPWHPGSVTSAGTADWVPTSWLSELAMAKAEDLVGLGGVAWLYGGSVLLYAFVLFRACRRFAPATVAAMITMAALLGSSQFISARPQVLSYALIALTVDAWLQTADDHRPRWWLIMVAWLWTMLHGMWPIGIVVGLVACVGLALQRVPRRVLARCAAIPAASLVISLATPMGPALFHAVFAVGARAQYFTEWGPPDVTQPAPAVVAVMVGVLVVAGLRRGVANWVHVALIALALGSLVYSARTTPVAGAIAAPLLAAAVAPWLPTRLPVDRVERRAVAASLAVLVALLAVADTGRASTPPTLPTWLDAEMASLPAETKVLNDDLLGGPFMWRYPRLDFLYSGYGDVYTLDELEAKTDLFKLNPGWQHVLASLGTDYALLPPEARLTDALEHQQGWRALHESPELVMLVAPGVRRSPAAP